METALWLFVYVYFVPAAHWRAVSFKELQNNNVFIFAHIISQSNLNVSANESFF